MALRERLQGDVDVGRSVQAVEDEGDERPPVLNRAMQHRSHAGSLQAAVKVDGSVTCWLFQRLKWKYPAVRRQAETCQAIPEQADQAKQAAAPPCPRTV